MFELPFEVTKSSHSQTTKYHSLPTMGSPDGVNNPNDRPTVEEEKHREGNVPTKFVSNAALSQATAIQKPSLFTKNMFLVS